MWFNKLQGNMEVFQINIAKGNYIEFKNCYQETGRDIHEEVTYVHSRAVG